MTSATSAVSVRKMSWTTRNSRLASALRTLLTFGSERNGFSPRMYIPLMSPSYAASAISTTVSPLVGDSSRPQAVSNFARIAASSTGW